MPASMPASIDCQFWFNRESVCWHTVDKDIKEALLVLDLLDKLLDFTLLGDVANNGDDLARDVLSVGLLNGLELLFGTANDVDLSTVNSESLSGL